MLLKGKLLVTQFEGFTASNVVEAKLPTFSTRESLFLQSLTSGQPRALWIPGSQVEEQTMVDRKPDGKKSQTLVTVKKRYILVVTATTPAVGK